MRMLKLVKFNKYAIFVQCLCFEKQSSLHSEFYSQFFNPYCIQTYFYIKHMAWFSLVLTCCIHRIQISLISIQSFWNSHQDFQKMLDISHGVSFFLSQIIKEKETGTHKDFLKFRETGPSTVAQQLKSSSFMRQDPIWVQF